MAPDDMGFPCWARGPGAGFCLGRRWRGSTLSADQVRHSWRCRRCHRFLGACARAGAKLGQPWWWKLVWRRHRAGGWAGTKAAPDGYTCWPGPHHCSTLNPANSQITCPVMTAWFVATAGLVLLVVTACPCAPSKGLVLGVVRHEVIGARHSKRDRHAHDACAVQRQFSQPHGAGAGGRVSCRWSSNWAPPWGLAWSCRRRCPPIPGFDMRAPGLRRGGAKGWVGLTPAWGNGTSCR